MLRGAEGDDRRARPGRTASTRSAWKATATGLIGAYDRVKQAMMLETDRPIALRQAILACRSGGTVSVAGVYGGFIDKFPMGAIVNRSLTIKIGADPRAALHAAAARAHPEAARSTRASSSPIACGWTTRPRAIDIFNNKEDECLKVVLRP